MSMPSLQEGASFAAGTPKKQAVPSDSSTQESPYGLRHIPVETWLGALGLMEYVDTFTKFHGIEDLLTLSEADIRDLGVRNHAHRARMVSTLTLYKDKLNKKMNRTTPRAVTPRSGTPPTGPGSGSATPPCMINQPDYATVQPPPTAHFTAAHVAQALLSNLRDQPTMKELAQFAWYHGSIPRQQAEKLTCKDGDFLVRDSTSKPGEFVLTACQKGVPLHFVVNKRVSVTSPGSPPLVEYQFEEEMFEKPTDLILHYLEKRKPITEQSGVVITQPVIRAVPLEFYDPRPPSPYGSSPRSSPWASPGASPHNSPLLQRKVGRAHRAGSQPLLSLDDGEAQDTPMSRKGSMPSLLQKFSTPPPSNSLTANAHGVYRNQSSPKPERKAPIHHRTGSEPSLSPTKVLSRPGLGHTSSDESLSKPAPPKPSRIPTMKKLSTEKRPTVQIRNKDLYDDDGKDYSDYDQIKSWPTNLIRSEKEEAMAASQSVHQDILRNSNKPNISMYDTPKNPFRNAQFMYDVPKSVREVAEGPLSENSNLRYTIPDISALSNFNLNRYDSELLTPNNKPLEPSAVTTIKSLLLDSNPKMMAHHVTFLDLSLLKAIGIHDLGLGVTSGLELMTLPQGRTLRQDIIERYECMSLFVTLTILMCSHPSDRSQMLNQWILVAVELRGQLGNMYSLSAIMDGLGATQITRLKSTWQNLKQHYSESFFMYEQRLCSLSLALDNASATLPLQNITVPHIMPLVKLVERDFTDIGALLSWEVEGPDYGLDTMLAHLDTVRIITQQCNLYKMTAENIFRDFEMRRDLADLFRTEMHQKLLWGARGATVNRAERLSKFPAVLDLLSQRVEPSPENSPNSTL